MDDFIGNWVKFGVFQKRLWCSSYLQSLAQNHCVNFFMSKVWKYEQILLTLNSISPILGVAKHFLMHFYFNWKLLPHRKNSKVNKQTINWKKLWNSGLVGKGKGKGCLTFLRYSELSNKSLSWNKRGVGTLFPLT